MHYFFKTLVIVLLATVSIQAQSNDHRAIISDSLEVYLQANYDKDYEKIMDMIYPKLFDIVTRENMIAMFEGMSSEGIDFEISNGIIDRISNLVVHEGERFATVDYRMDMMMRFTGIEYKEEATQNMILASFEGQYGPENVERKDGAFYIKTDKTMVAIAPEDSESWKFIEKNDQQPALLGMLIPAEVLEAFKE